MDASLPQALPRRHLTSDARATTAATALAALGLVAFFALAALGGPDLWVPVLLVGVLGAVTVPICVALSGRPVDRRLRAILLAALVLKLACALPRYAMNEIAYEGNADAGMYHEAGQVFRENAAGGSYAFDGAFIASFPDETQFVGYVVGGLYLLVGASQMAGYLFFAWLSFLGLLLVFRAWQIAQPQAPPHLAALLILLLPSTLYWPSSIGKDALMVLAIGMLTYGTVRAMSGRHLVWAAAAFGAGATLCLQVRPHLLMIALAGGAVSLLARRPQGAGRTAMVGRILLLVALVPAVLLGVSAMDDVFGSTADGGSFTISAALDRTAERTEVGGSSFETQPVHSPVDLPMATVNVLYRPFLFEARNLASLVSALEGTALLLGTIAAGRWLWRVGPAIVRFPVAGFAAGYTVAFVIAFSNIGNAGILARQRVQLLPVLMLLVAAAAEHRRLNSAVVGADEEGEQRARHDSTLDPRLVVTP